MDILDSFVFDEDIGVSELGKRAAENDERHGKRPNLNDLALLERPNFEVDIDDLFDDPDPPQLDMTDFRHPDFLAYIFGDPTGVVTPQPDPDPQVPQVRVRQVRQVRQVPLSVDGWEAENRRWKERAGRWLGIPNFADHHLYPWASLKPHLSYVSTEVRDTVLSEGFQTWGLTHGLSVLLVPTAIGTLLPKYRGSPFRESRSDKKKTREVSSALRPLLGYMDGDLRPGYIDTMFSSTGEETAWKFHNLDPMQITVCTCKCLRAPSIAHNCADVEANRMANDILLGCAAHHDLSKANLVYADEISLKKHTTDLGDCDCVSSASMPLAFMFRGQDSSVYEERDDLSTSLARHILEDITSEGSREYKQKGILQIERCFTFYQFPLDVTKTSAAFGAYSYKVDKATSELSRIDYPTLIADWKGGKKVKKVAKVKKEKESREPCEPSAPLWGVEPREPLWEPRAEACV